MLRSLHPRSLCPVVVAAFLFISLAWSTTVGAQTSPLWKEVAGWDVRVDVSLADSCFIFRVYEGMTILRVGFNKLAGNGYLMLGDRDWASLEEGKNYDLVFQFDQEEPWVGEATAIAFHTLVGLWMNIDKAGFLREMAEQQVLEVRYRGKPIARLKLDGSYAALMEMATCQELADEARGDSDPFDSESGTIEGDPFAL